MASLPPRNDRTLRIREIARQVDNLPPPRQHMPTPYNADEPATNPAIIVQQAPSSAEQAASLLSKPLLPLPVALRFPALLALLGTVLALAYLWLHRPV